MVAIARIVAQPLVRKKPSGLWLTTYFCPFFDFIWPPEIVDILWLLTNMVTQDSISSRVRPQARRVGVIGKLRGY